MSADRTTIADAVASILVDLSTPDTVRQVEDAGWNEKAWQVLDESGFTRVSVPEESGGSGGDLADALAMIKEVGRYATAVPVVETALLGGWALSKAGLELPPGPATVGAGHRDDLTLTEESGSWRLSGELHRVPWGGQSSTVVVIVDVEGVPHVAAVRTQEAKITPGRNLAGEPRDTLTWTGAGVIDAVPAPEGLTVDALRLRGALARATSMAGALERVADLTVQYTAEREQFGRPLARFQAVQRHIVRVVERTQTAAMAVETAALNASPDPDFFDVAAAKIVAGESASVAAQASHQAHGAMGMTKEYELGQLTRRLWAWRDEFGSEAYWSRRLGKQLSEAGADALWPRISLGSVAWAETGRS